MLKSEASEGRTVALYWDFENIHAGLCEEKQPGSYARTDFRFKPQEPLVNVQAVVDFAASFGPIAINRAHCNWQQLLTLAALAGGSGPSSPHTGAGQRLVGAQPSERYPG